VAASGWVQGLVIRGCIRALSKESAMNQTLVALTLLALASAAPGQDVAPVAQNASPVPAGVSSEAPPKPATLGLFVYPGSGQDAAKQTQDENECYLWARGQSGVNPTAPPTQAVTPDVPKGGAVKGAARGAAKGAAVGAVSDERHIGDEGSLDAGEGAAAGAAVGAAKGRRAQKKAEKQATAQAQQAAQTQDVQAKETFKKAWGACLEGRGYSVK
jgi:hypothetical protein